MKKVVRMSLLALTAVALLGSCKKKNNEPTLDPVNGTGTTNGGNGGGDNNGGGNGGGTQTTNGKSIVLQLADGQTSFKLVGLNGTDVIVEGAQSAVIAADGNATEWAYSTSNPVENTFTAAAGAKVTVKGALKSIAITAGNFKLIDLSAAPETFSGFYFFEKGEQGTISLEELKLGDINSLTHFFLGLSANLNSVGPRRVPTSIDLSKNINLAQLGVHIANVTTAPQLPMLTRLFLSESSAAGLAKFTTANYPALQEIRGFGAQYQAGQTGMNFSGHKALKNLHFSSTHLPSPIDISNSPTVAGIRTYGNRIEQSSIFYPTNTTPVINALNTPALTAARIILSGAGTLKKDGLGVTTHSGWTVVAQ